jgi:O-acetyl-ADP-ribose deacetylase (regulator of RNase III)
VIQIIRADITTLVVDAIVNAASEEFRGGGGVDGAIHRAAGPELLEECRRYPRLPTGEAVVTGGYALAARHVVHTVGPIWRGGRAGESELLERAYESVFRIARSHGDIRTIAFPAISTGVYGYPKREAARIALSAMRTNEPHFDGIIACLFSEEDVALYQEVLGESRNPRNG